MAEQLVTTKITPDALRMLRLIAAHTGEKQYEALRRILLAERRRLEDESRGSKPRPAPP